MRISEARVAIIHDWLLGFRGGEQVLDAMLEVLPQAEIFTLFYKKGTQSKLIESRPIYPSVLNQLPKVEKYYRYLLPLFPVMIERFNLKNFDLVLSSSHCAAKGIIPPPGALHLCYSYTPMRYVWDKYEEYFGGKLLEPLIYPWAHYLRMWDASTAHRVDQFYALSRLTQDRIRKYYRREAEIIHPFVNLDKFRPVNGDRGNYYLVVSAFAPYKRIDLAIQACQQLDRELWIVGEGQDEAKLRQMAGHKIKFLGKVPTADLPELYASARALLFPGEEDFGIVPLEAMASGTPVLAFGRGGVLETVIPGSSGLFFSQPTSQSLIDCIRHFENNAHEITKEKCVAQANRFSREQFRGQFERAVELAWNRFQRRHLPEQASDPKENRQWAPLEI